MNLTDADFERLATAAKNASEQAYAPYSKFPVGAAVLVESGEVFEGCNVENASFGLTICAERNAVFQAVAKGHRVIKAILIYAPTEALISPCGACRQVLNEFGPEAIVISLGSAAERHASKVSDLLPHAFGPKNLG